VVLNNPDRSPIRDVCFAHQVGVLDGDRVVWNAYENMHQDSDGSRSALTSLVLNEDTMTIDPGGLRIRISSPEHSIGSIDNDRRRSGQITRPFLELFENHHPDYTLAPRPTQ
jgi:hypothetical protein